MTWRDSVERTLGSPVQVAQPVGGGCISDGYRVELADGRRCFVKTGGVAGPAFEVEAAGLRWIDRSRLLRIPAVLASGPDFLALEWVEVGRAGPATEAMVGRGLAELHDAYAPGWGWDRPGFIGPLPQDNAPAGTPGEFWIERRLRPMARRAADAGAVDAEVGRLLDAIARKIDAIVPDEAPSRLHGDLWAGNLLIDAEGAPVLIDPAPYGGCREIDLAMMRLFGGFSDAVFRAYDEVRPVAAGYEHRVQLWQAYPLLVHAALFGGGYGAQALAALRRYA